MGDLPSPGRAWQGQGLCRQRSSAASLAFPHLQLLQDCGPLQRRSCAHDSWAGPGRLGCGGCLPRLLGAGREEWQPAKADPWLVAGGSSHQPACTKQGTRTVWQRER